MKTVYITRYVNETIDEALQYTFLTKNHFDSEESLHKFEKTIVGSKRSEYKVLKIQIEELEND